MATRKDCIDEVIEALGKRLNRKQVEDEFGRIEDRFEDTDPGMSDRERYQRVRDEMLKEHQEQSARRRFNERMDALKIHDLHRRFDAVWDNDALGDKRAVMGIEAMLNGINPAFHDATTRSGNQKSVAGLANAVRTEWVDKGFLADIEREGLDKVFTSRVHSDDMLRELFELDSGSRGRPGVTKNEEALEIAQLVAKWNKVAMDAQNREGAWIGSYTGHMVKMAWDPDKVRNAAGAGWWAQTLAKNQARWGDRALRSQMLQDSRMAFVGDVMAHADLRRTFGTTDRQAVEKILSDMYGGFIAGDHMTYTAPFDESSFPNLAAAASVHREIHWKSSADALDMFKKYSRFDGPTAILQNYSTAAKRYALLKTLGSEPDRVFEDLLVYADNKTKGTLEWKELDNKREMLKTRYAHVSGQVNKPIDGAFAALVYADMAVQRLSKLGSTLFAMISDNATISREIGYWGKTGLDRLVPSISGYFRGAEGSEKREVARLAGYGMSARLGYMASRFDGEDTAAGQLAKWEHYFFKYTGMTAATENKRVEAKAMMMAHAGEQRGKAWDELHPNFQRIMQAFGLGDPEWKLLNTTAWRELNGGTYLSPDVAHDLTDDAVRGYLRERTVAQLEGSLADLKERGGIAAKAQAVSLEGQLARAKAGEDLGPKATADQLGRVREDLALDLATAYAERGLYAVIDVGVRERAMLYGRTNLEHPNLHLALKLLLQFKQFPTAMIAKVWGRELFGGAKGWDRMTGITEMLVLGMVYGAATNFLSDAAKLQDPTSRWRNQPIGAAASAFIRGGMGSIYGDFLLGEFSRHGQTGSQALIGPTFGQIDNILEIWSDLTHMKGRSATAALGARMLRSNMPFANVWYTKQIVDFMFFYKFMDWLNPGYLERMERTMKDKQGIEFMVRPSQVSR